MDRQQIDASKNHRSYLLAARKFFEEHSSGMVAENHYNHDLESNFWRYEIQQDISSNRPNVDYLALALGCEAGRNIINLLVAGNFRWINGIDISKGNAINAQKFVELKLGFGRTVCPEGALKVE